MRLPFEYIVGFLKFLKRNNDIIEVITYDDLPWEDDYNYKNQYAKEFENWNQQLACGKRDKQKIYVLLQQDIDSDPARSMEVMKEQAELGIPSTFMLFADRVDRQKISEGIVEFTDYPLDFPKMQHLETERGFIFGYHSNAFEKGLFNRQKALEIFADDVKRLQQHFRVNYFSAHGGARGLNGEINRDLDIPSSLLNEIRWVHNGGSPIFASSYSDGGYGSPLYGLRDRDLRSFVATWKPGKRYRILIHPQYYATPWKPAEFYVGQVWYDEILNHTRMNPGSSVWEEFKLSL
jgi:hypothetical protein